ncbi:hypothetical protein RDWZM_004622 [Blomia tropicalis]|uniref:Uncharacterized protein n=1 Tax=Blomia tropicalis TaxID=40697 RepID=A0A9Q0M7J7_BLOTA|nr:hypothetical protein BLOT_016238 [Blomia tropicalis]KAJ6218810.1 hypothetical protein RDWZM_004622 [Blomia tropicalis]
MTSSTTTNHSIIASLARNNSGSHRTAVLGPRSMFRNQQRRMQRRQQRLTTTNAIPIVDMNNNNNNNNSNNVVEQNVNLSQLVTPINGVLSLDRVAILKAFAAHNQSTTNDDIVPMMNQTTTTTTTSKSNRSSRYEKPTTYKEARRQIRQQMRSSLPDPAIEQEFIRLRDTVPSIAGSNVSDLTIINEAISLICDLESQLIRKLKSTQNLPIVN